MKHWICLAGAVLLTAIAITACSKTENTTTTNAVLPPTRRGTNRTESVELGQIYTLESAMDAADLVAVIRVGDWLMETEAGDYTLFSCKAIKTFKGTAPEEILLSQNGGSYGTITNFPLFTDGNTLLVFLRQIQNEEHDNGYRLLGSFSTFFDAVEDGEGKLYYMDRYGILGESVEGCENYLFNTEKKDELIQKAIEADPIAEGFRYSYIFSADELEPLLVPTADGE